MMMISLYPSDVVRRVPKAFCLWAVLAPVHDHILKVQHNIL